MMRITHKSPSEIAKIREARKLAGERDRAIEDAKDALVDYLRENNCSVSLDGMHQSESESGDAHSITVSLLVLDLAESLKEK